MSVRVSKRLQCPTLLDNSNLEIEESVDNGKALGALYTDLSKGFNCLSHELLVANWMHMVLKK